VTQSYCQTIQVYLWGPVVDLLWHDNQWRGSSSKLDQITSMTEHPQITSPSETSSIWRCSILRQTLFRGLDTGCTVLINKQGDLGLGLGSSDISPSTAVLHGFISRVWSFLDPSRPTVVHASASDFAIGGWIGQTHTLMVLRAFAPVILVT
jgi:hypothetical protein